MKNQYKLFYILTSLSLFSNIASKAPGSCTAIPFFSYRSQTYYAARELVGWANDYHINLFDMCDYYGSFSATPEYTHSFRATELARCLLGDAITTFNCSDATLFVQGSQVPGRSNCAWFADYFGLPTDYKSTFILTPYILNFLVDCNWFIGLDPLIEGLYFRIHSPVVYTKWDLCACELIHNAGTHAYQAGYFAPTSIKRTTLNASALSFLSGNGSRTQANIDPLHYAQWNSHSLTDTKALTEIKLSDIVVALGWNFFQCEDYHFGINARISIPAGTRPRGVHFFEPIIGNGHYFGYGIGITSHIMLWRDFEYERYFGMYIEINLLHLCNTIQHRTFDLRGKPNSRYMLAAQVTPPAIGGLYGNPTSLTGTIQPGIPPITNAIPTNNYHVLPAQFKQRYTPVANLTYSTVEVNIPIQGNIALLFDYTNGDWNLDIGYSFFGRSHENVTIKNTCKQFKETTWVLKGDACMYGYSLADWAHPIDSFPFSGITTHNSIALTPSEHNATIFHGTNRIDTDSGTSPQCLCNQGIDNAMFAYTNPQSTVFSGIFNPVQAVLIDTPIPLTGIIQNNQQTHTSVPPRYIKHNDIDCGTTASYISNSIFIHVNYTWSRCDCWIPYCGIGGQIEFGQTNSCYEPLQKKNLLTCEQNTSCAVSQWGIWCKTGISFH